MLETIKELIENKQYAQLRKEIIDINVADIADMFDEIPIDEQTKIFRILPKDIAADVFSYLPTDLQQTIITSLTDREIANIVDNLFADDAADLFDEMPANVVRRILANVDPEIRRDINHLLQYPEDSAGSLMTVEFIDVKESHTVEQALSKIRREGIDKETINTCYVLDAQRHLIGTVSLRRLLLSNPDVIISDIMHDNVITVTTLMDQEAVTHMFQKYDFTSMPVVDSENRLVGIITVDDIVDIMQQEATEDIEMMAAITPTDKPYMRTGVFETWKKRIPWLLFLMLSATFTGKIIQSYEVALSSYVALTAFIPMLMGTGGNAGGQTSVAIIRSISLNEIEFKDIFKVVGKEALVALLCGVTLAATNFLKLLFIDQVGMVVAGIVSATLIVAVFIAKIVGCTLPILAKKIGFDPAVMASPFITTVVDALALFVYFQIATSVLNI